MKARLIKETNGNIKLLFKDGSFNNASLHLLANFLLNFKTIEDFSGKDGSWRSNVADMALYPAETLAYVSDTSELIVLSGDAFRDCFDASINIDNFISTEEYARLHNKTPEIIKVYCREGRIRAHKVGRSWMISKDEPYPVPARSQKPKTCGPKPKGNLSK